MSSSTPVAEPLQRERYAWTITVVWVLAGITAVGWLIGAVLDLFTLISWLDPRTAVPVHLDLGIALSSPTGRNSYSGTPYIGDQYTVTATSLSTAVSGLSVPTKVLLALAPAVWKLTIAGIAVLVARAAGMLRAGQCPTRLVVRMLHAVAAVLAIGSTLAQLLQAAANLGLGHIAWNSPALGSDGSGSLNAGATTFSFLPLIATIGILAAATVLDRALPHSPAGPANPAQPLA